MQTYELIYRCSKQANLQLDILYSFGEYPTTRLNALLKYWGY